MDTKLLARAVAAYVVGVVFVGAFVFIPAGTIRFFGGLLLIAVLFIPMFIMGIVMFVKSPSLLEKRLNSKEKEKTQKGVIAASLAMFVLGFVLAGLDFRFSWLVLPKGVQIAAAVAGEGRDVKGFVSCRSAGHVILLVRVRRVGKGY